jgi:hypothetical protein
MSYIVDRFGVPDEIESHLGGSWRTRRSAENFG